MSANSSERQPINVEVINPFVPMGEYRRGLQIALNHLVPHLEEKQILTLLNRKLMLGSAAAKESTYLQAAAELTVCSWFAYVAPTSFLYEPKLNPPKDVDCAFKYEEMQFNIEVKCADYERQHDITANSDFRMLSLGRLDNFFETFSNIEGLFASAEKPARLACAHHMDLKLKDYLLSAHKKFPPQINMDHLNVLIVCVDDQMDMNQWFGYLNGSKGFFTTDSFVPQDSYNNVDLVVLSNLYHRHHKPMQKDKILAHWDLSEAFNILIRNPNSTKSERIFSYFHSFLPNETNKIHDYVVDGDAPGYIKMALAIPHYVADEQLAKGIFRFQGYAADEHDGE